MIMLSGNSSSWRYWSNLSKVPSRFSNVRFAISTSPSLISPFERRRVSRTCRKSQCQRRANQAEGEGNVRAERHRLAQCLSQSSRRMSCDRHKQSTKRTEENDDTEHIQLELRPTCLFLILLSDVFGVCSPGSEAQIAYDERLERRKSQKS